ASPTATSNTTSGASAGYRDVDFLLLAEKFLHEPVKNIGPLEIDRVPGRRHRLDARVRHQRGERGGEHRRKHDVLIAGDEQRRDREPGEVVGWTGLQCDHARTQGFLVELGARDGVDRTVEEMQRRLLARHARSRGWVYAAALHVGARGGGLRDPGV